MGGQEFHARTQLSVLGESEIQWYLPPPAFLMSRNDRSKSISRTCRYALLVSSWWFVMCEIGTADRIGCDVGGESALFQRAVCHGQEEHYQRIMNTSLIVSVEDSSTPS